MYLFEPVQEKARRSTLYNMAGRAGAAGAGVRQGMADEAGKRTDYVGTYLNKYLLT